MKKSLGPKTFAYPLPVWLIGTYDKADKPNIMAASWAGICCSEPPCVSISLRKATYTFGNILEHNAFTVSIPSEHQVEQVDYAGIVSGKTVNKFETAGFTPIKSEAVYAPYVAECPVVIECSLLNTVEIGLHTQFIGKILDVKVDVDVINEVGFPDIEKIKPIIFSPGKGSYHAVGAFKGKAFAIGKRLCKDKEE